MTAAAPRVLPRITSAPWRVWGALHSPGGAVGRTPGLSLICKSLLGRNQAHENAISTQSLLWPFSCLRQKQFTLPVIKQG